MSICAAHGCTNELEPNRAPGRERKWCSDKCRRAQYAQPCVDCGTLTKNGSDGRVPVPRCVACGTRKSGETRRVWTRELLIGRIQEWAERYGSPPAAPDWSPTRARRLNDEARAERFERADGYWPSFETVRRLFGSWNAGMAAAGYGPRAPYGDRENQKRRRSMSTRRAA